MYNVQLFHFPSYSLNPFWVLEGRNYAVVGASLVSELLVRTKNNNILLLKPIPLLYDILQGSGSETTKINHFQYLNWVLKSTLYDALREDLHLNKCQERQCKRV